MKFLYDPDQQCWLTYIDVPAGGLPNATLFHQARPRLFDDIPSAVRFIRDQLNDNQKASFQLQLFQIGPTLGPKEWPQLLLLVSDHDSSAT